MSNSIEHADQAIADAIQSLVSKLGHSWTSDNEKTEIVRQIAELRASMNPVTIIQQR